MTELNNTVYCKNETEYSHAIGHHAFICRNPQFSCERQESGSGVELECKKCAHTISYTPVLPKEAQRNWKKEFDQFIEKYRR